MGHAPCLGSVVELTLLTGCLVNYPKNKKSGLTPHLPHGGVDGGEMPPPSLWLSQGQLALRW